jgi:uncharacterized protein with PIN domain
MSKLITARSNFALESAPERARCRGCKRKLETGERVYVSRYVNPHNRGQNCTAYLCNLEECRQEWDSEVFVKAGEQFDEEAAYELPSP